MIRYVTWYENMNGFIQFFFNLIKPFPLFDPNAIFRGVSISCRDLAYNIKRAVWNIILFFKSISNKLSLNLYFNWKYIITSRKQAPIASSMFKYKYQTWDLTIHGCAVEFCGRVYCNVDILPTKGRSGQSIKVFLFENILFNEWET